MDVKGMPLAYICSPYSGDVKGNTKRARRYSRAAADMGFVPVAPHLLFPQFMDEETERLKAIEMDHVLLERCDVLLICGDRISRGMESEIRHARRKGMKVMHLLEE